MEDIFHFYLVPTYGILADWASVGLVAALSRGAGHRATPAYSRFQVE